MYREKIRQLGSAALARHGTDVSAWPLGPGCWGEWEYSEPCVRDGFSSVALDRQYEWRVQSFPGEEGL